MENDLTLDQIKEIQRAWEGGKGLWVIEAGERDWRHNGFLHHSSRRMPLYYNVDRNEWRCGDTIYTNMRLTEPTPKTRLMTQPEMWVEVQRRIKSTPDNHVLVASRDGGGWRLYFYFAYTDLADKYRTAYMDRNNNIREVKGFEVEE